MAGRCCVVVLMLACVTASPIDNDISKSVRTPVDPDKSKTIDLKMKGAHPSMNDAYLCSSYSMEDLPEDVNYIVKFQAMADVKIAHHILLFGCDGPPARNTDIWKCPAVCSQGAQEQIMFAWAKAAPPTKLPQDVGFRVGRKSTIKNIVLQVHYKYKFNETAARDFSGIRIYVTPERQKYVAGIHLMLSYQINIMPNTPMTHADISCEYRSTKPMHPFAYRTHAHALGKVISGYMYNTSWYQIGKGNPQWPQAFYPATENIVVNPGDKLVARCSFDSTGRNRITHIGATGADEMCNFYIMYYTDSSVEMPYSQCGGNNLRRLVDNIPEDSDVPLPPNPALEEEAKGHHHHHPTPSEPTGKNLNMPFFGEQRYPEQEDYPDYSLYSEYLKSLGPLRNQKRYGQDYYEDLGDPDVGPYQQNNPRKNRNRNKAFEEMNRQLNMYSGLKQQSDAEYGSRGYAMKPTKKPKGEITEDNSEKTDNSKKHSLKAPGKLLHDSKWPRTDIKFGQIGGMSTDKEGNVYIFHRASRQWSSRSFDRYNKFESIEPIAEDTIVILDKTGKLIRKFGSNQFFMPHGITVDSKGNIWITDVALHQVMRIPKGASAPDLVLGKPLEPGSDNEHFCKPTDVAVLESGDFYVTDGYCNHRVLKYSQNGTLLDEWGHVDHHPAASGNHPTGTFTIVHSVTIAEDKNLVCVADRENGRIQCFDLDGNFRYVIKDDLFGNRLFAVAYCPLHGGVLFAVNGAGFDGKMDIVQGFTIDVDNGEVLQTWNIAEGLETPHDVTVDSNNHAVYVGELSGRVSRLAMNISSPKETPIDIPEKKGFTSMPSTGTPAPAPGDSVSSEKSVDKEKKEEKSKYLPSIIIGVLLIVPVVILLVITIIVRLHQSGKISCFSGRQPKVFSLQNFLGNSHKGFDRLSTEESDHELDPLDDSDQEEYTAPTKKQKA